MTLTATTFDTQSGYDKLFICQDGRPAPKARKDGRQRGDRVSRHERTDQRHHERLAPLVQHDSDKVGMGGLRPVCAAAIAATADTAANAEERHRLGLRRQQQLTTSASRRTRAARRRGGASTTTRSGCA